MGTVKWSTRADADLVDPRSVSRDIQPTEGVCQHWGGVGPFARDDHDGCLQLWRDWQAMHLADEAEGYVDIAYNLGACGSHGILLEGRSTQADPIVRGGANGNRRVNGDRYSIVAMWGRADGEPTPELLVALRAGIDFLREQGGAGNRMSAHRDLSATSCPGDDLAAWIELGAPPHDAAAVLLPVVIDLGAWSPTPAAARLDGMTLTLDVPVELEQPDPPDPEPPEPSDPPDDGSDEDQDDDDDDEGDPTVPPRPSDGQFSPGTRHPSFTAMGERFLVWLEPDEIAHDGDGYQPGPVFSEFDDFNIRKVQALMSNAVDPVGKAYFGPLQWARLFEEGRPSGAKLPDELAGRVPPQLRDGGGDDEPDEPQPPADVPPVPDAEDFEPGTRADWVTAMGRRFLVWMKPDEIHKAGSTYTPGPVYSVYDDRNVRVIQALMDNRVDDEGEEFLGPKQWKRLFEEGRTSGASVPGSLKPGGSSGGGGGGPSELIPVRGHRITQHFGVPGSYAAGEHTGVDLGSDGDRTIRCVASGTVVSAGWAGEWGRRVVVRHSNGRWSWYCHLASISVRRGQRVGRGRKLGVMGDSGNARGVHLHYQESTGGFGYWDYKRPILLAFAGY